ncbi:hypothetical protein CCE02nite_19050 [Cellulosimicrobium cellulans]|uniref:Uncharacterized protein n=1 Tax=Cellulosimicrobium cellulans TaxID=1710 RepID=A0A4Y4DXX8_CELCE|nr:hypothetical protein CCE02nite_19050 [Cellulosimicrobium cellulans]
MARGAWGNITSPMQVAVRAMRIVAPREGESVQSRRAASVPPAETAAVRRRGCGLTTEGPL